MPVIVGPGDPGSTVDLNAVWLNVAADLSDSRAFRKAGETLSQTTTALVDVRQLIGRRRLVRTGSGDPAESGALTFEQCDSDDVAWLRARVGVLVCYRDHVGSKWFGVYRDIQAAVATGPRTWADAKTVTSRTDVSLTLEQVTHSEAV